MEMYIKSIDGFGGDQEFLSKFGVEIRNQVVFSVARRRFSEDFGEYTTQVRPNEGDVIWFPLNQRAFVVRYVNKYEIFYQLGALQTWELTCEVFEYSGETFNTGIPEIDGLQVKYDTNIYDWALKTESNEIIMTEDGDYIVASENVSLDDLLPNSDNDEIQRESDLFVDFSSIDPFSEGNI